MKVNGLLVSLWALQQRKTEGKHNEWNQLNEVDGMSLCAAEGRSALITPNKENRPAHSIHQLVISSSPPLFLIHSLSFHSSKESCPRRNGAD